MSIFDKRENFKPFEYPEVIQFSDAVAKTYWTANEHSFSRDATEYNTILTDAERSAIKKTVLAISQIEVGVKSFWSNLPHRIPKPEIHGVCSCFSDCEFRHSIAYSKLLEVLGLNSEFDNLQEHKALIDRHNYLSKYKDFQNSSLEDLFKSLLLFTLFIENVSLFGQFYIIMSFNKHKNIFKDLSTTVDATSKEEAIHSEFGIWVINKIKEENPTWWGEPTQNLVREYVEKAYEAEKKVLGWIFEDGYPDFLPEQELDVFLKDRFNSSLRGIGIEDYFSVDRRKLKNSDWFEVTLLASTHADFFDKRPITYSRDALAGDLF